MKGRKLNRAISKLRISKPTSKNILCIATEVNLVSYEIKDAMINQLDQKEARAADTIKSNPKFFYSYAKQLAKFKSTVAPLKNSQGVLTNDPEEKAEILQLQYVSAFSDSGKVDIETCKSYIKGPMSRKKLVSFCQKLKSLIQKITLALSKKFKNCS